MDWNGPLGFALGVTLAALGVLGVAKLFGVL